MRMCWIPGSLQAGAPDALGLHVGVSQNSKALVVRALRNRTPNS